MIFPRTPLKKKLPPPEPCRASWKARACRAVGQLVKYTVRRPFFSLVGGACALKPVDFAENSRKSLIVYNYGPTLLPEIYTGCSEILHSFGVLLHESVFGTFALFSIYLFNNKKKKGSKPSTEKEGTSTGFFSCLFFNPPVWSGIHGFSVGMCGWKHENNQWHGMKKAPIHASTGFYAPLPPQVFKEGAVNG